MDMDKIVDSLKTHLIDSLHVLLSPGNGVQRILSRPSFLYDSLVVGAILGLSGMSFGVTLFGGDFKMQAALALVLVPLFGFIILIKLSWALVKQHPSLEVVTSHAVIALGINAFISGVVVVVSFGFLNLWASELAHWIHENSLANFLYFAMVEPERFEQYSDNKGFRLFLISGAMVFPVVIFYWLSLWFGVARQLSTNGIQRHVSAYLSLMLVSLFIGITNVLFGF